MKKLKLGLFIGSVFMTLGAIAASIYYIEENKKNKTGFKIKGVFDVFYLRNFKNYNIKKDANITNENIYFNYEVPSKNKSIKQNENKLFNIGTQTELLVSLATFKLIEKTEDEDNEAKKISLDDSINKWFSKNGSDDDPKIAEILDGDLLKQENPQLNGWEAFSYLNNLKIYNLLTHTSTLPDFNNLKTSVTEDQKNNYYKYPINSYEDTTFNKSRTKWKLLDFFNLVSSNLIEKTKNNIFDGIHSWEFNEKPNLNNRRGPLEKEEYKGDYYGNDYSALNFVLLGNILEKVYNSKFNPTKAKTFDEIVKEYVLIPLGMNKTFYDLKKIDKFEGKTYKDYDTSFLNASKGYVSTLEDLSKLYKALFKKDSKLLKSETFEKFFELVFLPKAFEQKPLNQKSWNGNGNLRILANTFDYNTDLLKNFKNKILYVKGISPDFRSYSFYCLDKEIFFTVAADVPYSYYSTSSSNQKDPKGTYSELTFLIDKTFDFDILLLLDEKNL